jgi:hypothetical protein
LKDSEFPDEMALADGGYQDGYELFETPTGEHNDDQRMKAIARARHETVNRRFKRWRLLKNTFICPLGKHYLVFKAVANITQLEIKFRGMVHLWETEEEMTNFDVEYFDNYDEDDEDEE